MNTLTPRTAIAFLRSVALSGETLSEEDLTRVDGALEELRVLENEHAEFRSSKERFLKLLKSGDLLLKDLNIGPGEWGFARSLFLELAAWIEE